MNWTELDLMRLLQGELPEERARELRERLERDPGLARDYDRLRRTWEGLALPPSSPVPPGFAPRVMARVRTVRPAEGLSLRAAPVWVRATAAAALVAGTVLGIGVGGRLPASRPAPEPEPGRTVQASGTEEAQSDDLIGDTLAGSYWDTLESLP
jgi:anti-sigma factor RsiW